MGFHEDMAKLQKYMKLLEREYEQWFSGALQKPPWESKRVCDEIVQRYNRNMPRNLQEQAIFGMHQSKYNTYTEMWNRRLRLKEEGRLPSGQVEKRRPTIPKPAPAASGGDDHFKKVYDTYVAAKQKKGEATASLNYDSFKKALEKQATQLRSNRGFKDVNFGVAIKNGKVSVVARPKK